MEKENISTYGRGAGTMPGMALDDWEGCTQPEAQHKEGLKLRMEQSLGEKKKKNLWQTNPSSPQRDLRPVVDTLRVVTMA